MAPPQARRRAIEAASATPAPRPVVVWHSVQQLRKAAQRVAVQRLAPLSPPRPPGRRGWLGQAGSWTRGSSTSGEVAVQSLRPLTGSGRLLQPSWRLPRLPASASACLTQPSCKWARVAAQEACWLCAPAATASAASRHRGLSSCTTTGRRACGGMDTLLPPPPSLSHGWACALHSSRCRYHIQLDRLLTPLSRDAYIASLLTHLRNHRPQSENPKHKFSMSESFPLVLFWRAVFLYLCNSHVWSRVSPVSKLVCSAAHKCVFFAGLQHPKMQAP